MGFLSAPLIVAVGCSGHSALMKSPSKGEYIRYLHRFQLPKSCPAPVLASIELAFAL